MKLIKRTGIYKASNLEFNPITVQATSYGWWIFSTKFNGKVIFNSHRYSPSTGKQQGKVTSLMAQLGISIDLKLRFTRLSLESLKGALQDELTCIMDCIDILKADMIKPRARKSTNVKRQEEIDNLNKHYDKVLELFKEVMNDDSNQ